MKNSCFFVLVKYDKIIMIKNNIKQKDVKSDLIKLYGSMNIA